MPTNVIHIALGESGESFLKRNNIPEKGHLNRQPAGLNFYKYRWNSKQLGTIHVNHGSHSFSLNHGLSILGTEDTEFKSAGISGFNLNVGLTADETVPHDEARRRVYDLLETLANAGWKANNYYENPRLQGEQAFLYSLEDATYGCLPIDYTPSLEQWMTMDSGMWCLVADGVFLELHLRRDRKKMEADKPGAYFMSLKLASQDGYAKSHFVGDERAQWQALWVEKVRALKKLRYTKEKMLEKQGYDIFQEYEEARIHPEDPVEP